MTSNPLHDWRRVQLCDELGPIWFGTFGEFCKLRRVSEEQRELFARVLADGGHVVIVSTERALGIDPAGPSLVVSYVPPDLRLENSP